MSVQITVAGDTYSEALKELLGFSDGLRELNEPRGISAPAVSYVSSDTGGEVSGAIQGTGGKDVEVVAVEAVAPKPRGRKPKTEIKLPEGPALNISTGGERVDPETAEKDAADASLVEPPTEEAKTYTLDDVRNAAKPYIDKWTIAAAQSDLQDVLEAAAGVRAISKLNTADQAQLKKAVEAFEAAGKAEARFVKAAA